MYFEIIEDYLNKNNGIILKLLLTDKTTKKYIRWCSDTYSYLGIAYKMNQEIFPNLIQGFLNKNIIQPRAAKEINQQMKRTRDKAEVFTPSWICNKQNNLIDTGWLNKESAFNQELQDSWQVNGDKIIFLKGKSWKKYVDAKRLELSCGEAPYLVSRYDTVSGKMIPLKERIGLLDRKFRVINENVSNTKEWIKWAIRAVQSCYGYDYQGDNVFLARLNILCSFLEYSRDKEIQCDNELMKKIANIVAWNIWQMDGITYGTPYSVNNPTYSSVSLFSEDDDPVLIYRKKINELPSRIFDWRSKLSLEYKSIIKGG